MLYYPCLPKHHAGRDGDQNIALFEADTLKYWNIFGSGLSGPREANGDKFYYLKDVGFYTATVGEGGKITIQRTKI